MEDKVLHSIIVMYTLSEADSALRSQITEMITKKLEGHWINESAYSLENNDLKEVREVLSEGTSNIDLNNGSFISILYSAALVNYTRPERFDVIIEEFIKGTRQK